jgi:hypothetical protein
VPSGAPAAGRRPNADPGGGRTSGGGALMALFACMYFAALRPGEAVTLRRQDCHLPHTGWGWLTLEKSRPEVNRRWTDTSSAHDERGLRYRAVTEIRRVPIPPELVAILREHIDTFGTAPDSRIFASERAHVVASTAKASEFDDTAQPQQVIASPLAMFLLQVSRDATVDDASQGRVLKFWRFVRATWLAFAAVTIVGAVIFGTAVAGGAVLIGLHPHMALGLGVGGSATFLITATFRAGRCILLLVRALSDVGQQPHSPRAKARHTDQLVSSGGQ